MDEFPSNSIKPKTGEQSSDEAKSEENAPKKVEKIVEGKVVRRKKPIGSRFVETFIGGDIKSVVGYVFGEVLVPAAQDAMVDAISQGIERVFFGENRSSRRSRFNSSNSNSGTNRSIVSYNRYSEPARSSTGASRSLSNRARSRHEFEEIILGSRAEAEEVLRRMDYYIHKYTVATVADLYGLVGVTSAFTDENYGWVGSDIEKAGVRRVRSGGYLLDLPEPQHLE